MRKFFSTHAHLLTAKIALVLASVESAAMVDCMFVLHETMTALSSPIFDYIDLLSGNIFANAASTW